MSSLCVCLCVFFFFFWGGGGVICPLFFPRDGTDNNVIRVATGEINSRINVDQSQVLLLEKKNLVQTQKVQVTPV